MATPLSNNIIDCLIDLRRYMKNKIQLQCIRQRDRELRSAVKQYPYKCMLMYHTIHYAYI